MVSVPFKLTYGTSDPPSPSNSQPFPARITPTGNYMPCNNPSKPVPHIPNEPDSDPSYSDYLSLEISDSSESGYSKRVLLTCNNRWRKIHNNERIKNAPSLQPSH